MKPTHEDYLNSHAKWSINYKHFKGSAEFWGYGCMNDCNGMWNAYLYFYEQMFTPEDFAKLVMEETEHEFGNSLYKDYDYYKFPEINASSGLTLYEISTHLDRTLRHDYRTIKVGWDYGHLWNREGGYQANLNSVTYDIKCSIDKFIKLFPNYKYRSLKDGSWIPITEIKDVAD